jgi:hypothetical protein
LILEAERAFQFIAVLLVDGGYVMQVEGLALLAGDGAEGLVE